MQSKENEWYHAVILVDKGLHELIRQNLLLPYSRHYFFVPFRKQRLSLREMKY